MLSTNISFSTWIPCHTNKESLGKWKHNYGSNERSIGPVCQKSQTKIISEDQQWLLIADVFKSHWTKVKRSSGKMCHNNMTIIFQPLHISINRSCKSFLWREAQSWYSPEIEKQIKEGKKTHEINVDTRISIMNPLHAKWVVSFYGYMKNQGDIALTGWRKSNIEEVFNSEQDSNPFKKVILTLEKNVLLDELKMIIALFLMILYLLFARKF